MPNLQETQASVEQTIALFPDEITEEQKEIIRYNLTNKYMRYNGRWCPQCNNKYELKGHEEHSNDRVEQEQFLSGICGTKCWEIYTADTQDGCQLQGVQSEYTTILTDDNGKAKAIIQGSERKVGKKKKKKMNKGWKSGFLL